MSLTPQQRLARLESDFNSVRNIASDWLSYEGISGAAPHFEAYRFNIKIRTIINSTPTYRDHHTVEVALPTNYPKGNPTATMTTKPPPFHPNWYAGGKWCHGTWHMSESLGAFVVRLVQTLQFNALITNEDSAANSDANNWYKAHRNSALFPCDTTPLPDPETGRFRIVDAQTKPRFQIKS
jgi:ubiquitin-protein ligase